MSALAFHADLRPAVWDVAGEAFAVRTHGVAIPLVGRLVGMDWIISDKIPR